jgi:predicted MFS family arabinose efflux permease
VVAVLASIAAWWIWRVMPEGVKPPAMKLEDWRELFTHPVLMAMVMVTALSGAAQFTLFAYFAPYYRQVLGADAAQTSGLFFWFGGWGLLGNLLLSRYIDRIGAARVVALALSAMAVSLLIFPLAVGVVSMAAVMLPWALGSFSSNSAQQARMGGAAPSVASALLALNTSAIYLGQAVGAAGGGAIVAAHAAAGDVGKAQFAGLSWVALGWMIAAVALSVWAQRRMEHAGGRI